MAYEMHKDNFLLSGGRMNTKHPKGKHLNIVVAEIAHHRRKH